MVAQADPLTEYGLPSRPRARLLARPEEEGPGPVAGHMEGRAPALPAIFCPQGDGGSRVKRSPTAKDQRWQ